MVKGKKKIFHVSAILFSNKYIIENNLLMYFLVDINDYMTIYLLNLHKYIHEIKLIKNLDNKFWQNKYIIII